MYALQLLCKSRRVQQDAFPSKAVIQVVLLNIKNIFHQNLIPGTASVPWTRLLILLLTFTAGYILYNCVCDE